MTVIQIDPLGTTTLACTSSTVTDLVDDKDSVAATATGVATTIAATGGVNTRHIHMTMAEQYVESLSDEQLAEMTQKVDNFMDQYTFNLTTKDGLKMSIGEPTAMDSITRKR